mgnify:CR=1 FL=1
MPLFVRLRALTVSLLAVLAPLAVDAQTAPAASTAAAENVVKLDPFSVQAAVNINAHINAQCCVLNAEIRKLEMRIRRAGKC